MSEEVSTQSTVLSWSAVHLDSEQLSDWMVDARAKAVTCLFEAIYVAKDRCRVVEVAYVVVLMACECIKQCT